MIDNLKNEAKEIRTKAVDTAKTGWFAGMGALSRVETEGRDLFDSLVKQGKNKRRSRNLVEKAVDRVEATGGNAVDRVSGGVKEVSGYVMEKAGIPTRDQLELLIDRVDELTKKLEDRVEEEEATS